MDNELMNPDFLLLSINFSIYSKIFYGELTIYKTANILWSLSWRIG